MGEGCLFTKAVLIAGDFRLSLSIPSWAAGPAFLPW